MHAAKVQTQTKKTHQQRFETSSKILLVDDNAINLVIAKRFLNKWQLEVDVAKNGKEAVDKVKAQDYGLIFMDINMPEMDGYEATRIIRSFKEEKYQRLPIVALTASVFDALKYQAVEAGMNDYLSKPFKPQELYDMVDKHMIVS
jgi:CheY-like chemotaxis protein